MNGAILREIQAEIISTFPEDKSNIGINYAEHCL
jgi:hypothetical protein